jgi:hypothetical protein
MRITVDEMIFDVIGRPGIKFIGLGWLRSTPERGSIQDT